MLPYFLGRSVSLLNFSIDHATNMLIPFAQRNNYTTKDYEEFWDGYFAN